MTFLYNLIAAICIAYIIYLVGVYRWMVGLKLGLLCGLGFGLAATGIPATWEKRSIKLVLLDGGYALVGIAICGAIIAAWH